MTTDALLLLLSSLGVIQSLFFAIYLFTSPRGHRLANVLFALLILSISVRVGKSVFNHFLVMDGAFRNVGLAAQLATGPLLWFYGLLLLQLKDRVHKKDGLHFLPALLFFLLAPVIPNEKGELISRTIYFFILLQLAVYLLLSFNLWRKQTQAPLAIERDWYQKLLWAVAGLWLYYTGIFFSIIPSYLSGAIFYSLLVYAVAYAALHRAALFTFEKTPARHRHNAPDKETLEQLLRQVVEKMEKDKVYLDPDLSLVRLAQSVQSSARFVSRAINEHTGKNFSEFVNTYRVEHAKRLLASDPEAKAALLAYDCGFHSISAFYTAFRQHTATTPHQFRQTIGN